MQFPSSVVLVFFLSNSLFEQFFLLVYHYPFQTHGALLQLDLTTVQLINMLVLEHLVHLLSLLNLFELPLLSDSLFFQLLLVPVSGSEQLLRLLIGYVS